MRFSLRVGNDLPLADYGPIAQAAERAGFDQIWVSHDLFRRSSAVIAAAMAAATRRLQIGIAVLNPYSLHPAEIAMLAATLDEWSGSRFNLGLGAGSDEFLRWAGLEQARPLAAVREAIRAVRALQRGERGLSAAAPHWQPQAFLRFEAPRVTPIYVGAGGPRLLRLAGQLADGVLPLLLPPEAYYETRPLVEAGLAERDPALGELDFGACVWVSLAEERQAALRPLVKIIGYYGGALSPAILSQLGLSRDDFAPVEQALAAGDEAEAFARMDERMFRLAVAGTAAEVVARLEPLAAAGLRHVSVGQPWGPDRLRAIDLMGRAVLPRFRE
jgi:5,10-methylenetetrahydromethanopterin reductase